MNRTNIRYEVLTILGNLHKEYPNKSPYIFGPGFEKSGLKSFDADKETVIPDTLCINSHILELLSDVKTVFHIDKYMEASGRSSTVNSKVNRVAAIVIMLSSVSYSFNMETFPYCDNSDISQMWADMEQMCKGDHVCCTIIAMATRGRNHTGFLKQHAARFPMAPVSILDIPKFEKPSVNIRFSPPPPGGPCRFATPGCASLPPRTKPPEPKDLPRSFADALDVK